MPVEKAGAAKAAKPVNLQELEERVKIVELRARELEGQLRIHEAQAKLKAARGKG
jgi:hypothetical protein